MRFNFFCVFLFIAVLMQIGVQESQAAIRASHLCAYDCDEACHLRGRSAGACVRGVCHCRTDRGT